MRGEDFLHSGPELLRLCARELPGHRHIILQALPVLLPVDVDTELVLGERIALLLRVGFQLLRPAGKQMTPFPNIRCLQNILGFERLPERLLDCKRQADGADGGEPHRDEVRRHAEGLCFQLLCCNLKQLLFHFRFRRNDILRLQLRHRQRLAVDLAVRCERQCLHLHIDVRNHIFRQRLRQICTQLLLINFCGCRVINTEQLRTVYLLHSSCRSLHAGEAGHDALDFPKLDTEAAHLDLLVDTAQIFQLALRIPAHEIPRAIHSGTRQEGTINENLRGFLRTLPVAACCLNTKQAELSRDSPRQQLPLAVHDCRHAVRYRPANRDVCIRPARIHQMIYRIYGKFSRSIGVIEFDRCRTRRLQLFPANHQILQRQIVLIQQLHSQLRGQIRSGNLILDKILIHARQIPAKSRRKNMNFRPACQQRIEDSCRGIKAEARLLRPAVSRMQVLLFYLPGDIAPETFMPDHDSFWPARGAGGIDHIGKRCRPAVIDRPAALAEVRFLQEDHSRHCKLPFSILFGKERPRRNEHLRPRILQHVLQAFRRIFVIQRDIGSACLEYCHHAHEEFLPARQHNRHKAVLRSALPDELCSQYIRLTVQLRIGHRADLVHHGAGVRIQLCLLLKQIDHGFLFIKGHSFPLTKQQQLLLFLFGNQMDILQCRKRMGYHIFDAAPDGLGKGPDKVLFVLPLCKTKIDFILPSQFINEGFQLTAARSQQYPVLIHLFSQKDCVPLFSFSLIGKRQLGHHMKFTAKFTEAEPAVFYCIKKGCFMRPDKI